MRIFFTTVYVTWCKLVSGATGPSGSHPGGSIMNSVPQVRDIMHQNKHSVTPGTSVFEAMDFVVAKKLAGVPVIDSEDKLVGFLTEKDCLRLQVVGHQYNMTGRTVSDIMSGINQALHPDMDLLGASTAFLECNFATLPVIEGESLIGSITRHELLQAIQGWYQERGANFKNEKHAQTLIDNPSSIEQLQSLVGRSSNAQLASVLGKRHSGK